MTSLDEQLDQFAGEPPEPVEEPPKPKVKRTRRKHVHALSTGQPIPGEERSSVNLRHWNALVTTNPDYTKPFDRGRFKGTTINATWREMRMTEHFGPVGIGWGMDKPEFQLVPIEGNGELLVYCTVGLWYVEDGRKAATVYGMGGDKVIRRERAGLSTNDEAFKSALTDAMGNAMKRIGVAGDVHLGLFDDDKYVREAREAFMEPPAPPTSNGHTADPDAEPQLTPEHAKEIIRAAVEQAGQGRNLFAQWYSGMLNDDERLVLRPHIQELKEICAEADKIPAKPARKSAAA